MKTDQRRGEAAHAPDVILESPHPAAKGGRRAARRTYGLLIGAWIAVLWLLAACSASTPTPTPTLAAAPVSGELATAAETPVLPATPAAPSGRVVLWHSWAGADGDALSAILERAQADAPDLVVDTLFVAYDDLLQSYASAVQAGGGPDLVVVPNWWLGDLVAADVAQPLDERVDAETLAGYWPAALENLRWGGRLYGLPVTFELVSLYVNQSLAPINLWPATTTDMLALAQAAPQQGAGLYANLYHLYWGIPAYGGQLMDEDGAVVLDRTNGAADFLAWLAAMQRTPGTFVDQDYGMLLDRFKKGEFAYFVDGPWSAGELAGALGDSLNVAPLPAGPASSARPWLSADGLVLNPRVTPEQRERALWLAEYITGAASGGTWAAVAQRLPAHRAADVGDDPILQGFVRQAATAESMPSLPEMEQVWGYGGDMVLKVLNDVLPPAAAVREATALINEANGK